MLNKMGQVSFSNLADYQLNMVKGTVDSVNYYSLGDSRRSLPIRYLKQQPSGNDDNETGLKHKQFNSTYYEYHLTPVIENQPMNPQIQIDETKQGMNATSTGEMVIISVDKPLVNDLFNFYIDSHQSMGTQKELFRITEVTFQRTSAGLNLYRLQYETATVQIQNIYVEKSFFWFNDFRRFYSTKYIASMKELATKNYLSVLDKYYRPAWSILYDETLTKEVNLLLNQVILYIKYKDTTNSNQLPLILINGFDPSKVYNPLSPLDERNIIHFDRADVWYEEPGYIRDATKEYEWTDGKVKNELAFCIWELVHFYKPFIIDVSEDEISNQYQDVQINEEANKLNDKMNTAMQDMAVFRNSIKSEIETKEAQPVNESILVNQDPEEPDA